MLDTENEVVLLVDVDYDGNEVLNVISLEELAREFNKDEYKIFLEALNEYEKVLNEIEELINTLVKGLNTT